MDTINYEQGKTTLSLINPWGLQLCKKQAEKLHEQLIGDENVTVPQSKATNKSNNISRRESLNHLMNYIFVLPLKINRKRYLKNHDMY